jgi:hypothetical protein
VLALAAFKALKVEAQAAIQCGAASARANKKEPVAQGEAAKVAPTQMGEGAPPPREVKARGSDGAKAPSIVEATEVEATKAGCLGPPRPWWRGMEPLGRPRPRWRRST